MKSTNPVILKYVFVFIGALELSAHLFELPEVSKFTKPLLMPVLLIYFKNQMTGKMSLSFLLAMLALVFSWIGDVMLMYQQNDQLYFILGLGAFSIAQILYIFSFNKARNLGSNDLTLGTKLGYSAPFLLFGCLFVYYVLPEAKGLELPIVAYAALLVSMVISAALRNKATNQQSHNQVFFGALLFLFSDSLIAINKFLYPMDMPNLFIMLTYILAQWNIVAGLLAHYNKK